LIVRVLGSAAGGGVPQWNCACANCSAARSGLQPRRSQSTLAVSAHGARWLLLNCSPDIGLQIESFAPLQPQALRGTPIDGVLVTDANVDHLGGLATLRQKGCYRFIIRSSAVTRDIAISQPAFAPFASLPHRWIAATLGERCEAADRDDVVEHALTVRMQNVPGTTPGYAGRRCVDGAVVAYEITSQTGGPTICFAPVFTSIDVALRAAIERADVAFVDGTFYHDNELLAAQLLDKTARELGHQPVGGPDGTLAQLRGIRTRIIFTHLNNSNPMLDPRSEAAEAIREFGAEIAFDGMTL
jgi:pyrroloquinoline quinone biosynthesis protein B